MSPPSTVPGEEKAGYDGKIDGKSSAPKNGNPGAASEPANDSTCQATNRGGKFDFGFSRISKDYFANSLQHVAPGIFNLTRVPQELSDEGYTGQTSRLSSDPEILLAVVDAIRSGAPKLAQTMSAASKCSSSQIDDVRADCLEQQLEATIKILWSRSPSLDERAKLRKEITSALAISHDNADALGQALLRAILNPRFWFVENSQVDPLLPAYLNAENQRVRKARALARLLWNSVPDEKLLQIASSGSLDTPAGVDEAVKWMTADAKFDAQIRQFALEWLGVQSIDGLARGAEYEMFNDAKYRSALKEELVQLVKAALITDNNVASLLTSDKFTTTPELNNIYSPVEKVGLVVKPAGRRGILGLGAVHWTQSFPEKTAPFKRARFVIERLLCKEMGRPADVSQVTVPPHKDGEHEHARFKILETAPVCSSCHKILNPLGFALDVFDPVGRYRQKLDGFDLSAAGTFEMDETIFKFRNTDELSQQIQEKSDFSSCVAQHFVRKTMGADLAANDACGFQDHFRKYKVQDGKFSSLVAALSHIVTGE